VAEHLLDAAEVGAAFEQVRRERVPEQVRVYAARLEPRLLGQTAQDQEDAGARERAALGVQEKLGTVAAIEEGTAAREVALQRGGSVPAERHYALLAALADHPDEPFLEIDAALLEADRLGDAQAGAVEKLDQGAVAQCPGRRAVGRRDQAFRFARRQRRRQPARAAGKRRFPSTWL
jgi:hypothetical protein